MVDSGMTTRVWATNKRRQVFAYVRGKWHPVPGGLKHVSSGQAGLWGVSNAGLIYYRRFVTAKRPKGRSWRRVPGRLKQIDSGPRGIVCGVSRTDDVMCRTQIHSRLKWGKKWTRVPGKLKYISCGEYGIWGVNKENEVYFREGVTRSNPSGLKWRRVGGRLRQIEAGKDGQVWGVGTSGRVYVRTGVTLSKPWGVGWKTVKTRKQWLHITIGVGTAFGVSTNGRVYRTAPSTGGNFTVYICEGGLGERIKTSLAALEPCGNTPLRRFNSVVLKKATKLKKIHETAAGWFAFYILLIFCVAWF